MILLINSIKKHKKCHFLGLANLVLITARKTYSELRMKEDAFYPFIRTYILKFGSILSKNKFFDYIGMYILVLSSFFLFFFLKYSFLRLLNLLILSRRKVSCYYAML
jgi:hypothetical protein